MTPLRPGDRVALLVPGSLTYLEAVHRLLTAGIVPIPLDPRLTTFERDRILAGLTPALEVTDDLTLAELLATLPAPGLPLARPMHCTSGTTGTPTSAALMVSLQMGPPIVAPNTLP